MVEVPVVGVVEVTAALVVRRGAGAVGALLVLAFVARGGRAVAVFVCLSGGYCGLPGETIGTKIDSERGSRVYRNKGNN